MKGIYYFNKLIESDATIEKLNEKIIKLKEKSKEMDEYLSTIESDRDSYKAKFNKADKEIKELENKYERLQSELTKLRKETWWDKLLK
ncbi:MAG: hypothetical protein U5K54_15915 [Cytophagales bacterium]|nr:hypothetical protein [Cytophagales bacterium]